eukprot:3227777-Rhodomonas_salina.3
MARTVSRGLGACENRRRHVGVVQQQRTRQFWGRERHDRRRVELEAGWKEGARVRGGSRFIEWGTHFMDWRNCTLAVCALFRHRTGLGGWCKEGLIV